MPDQSKVLKAHWISSIGLCLIGGMSMFYSLLFNHFAQLKLQLPFLSFPIFPGEVLLGVCFFLLFMKWRFVPPQTGRWTWVVGFYCAWVVGRALYGYATYGPLSLRISALFYYPLFFLIGKEFYHREFFNQRMIKVILSVFVLTGVYKLSGLMSYYTYANFTYLILYLVVWSKLQGRGAKVFFLLAIVVLIHYPLLFQGARAQVLSFACAVIFLLVAIVFGVLKIKNRDKIIISVVVIVAMGAGISRLMTQNKLMSIIKFDRIIPAYQNMESYIREKEATFVFPKLDVKLYSPDEESSLVISEDPYSAEAIRDKHKELDEAIGPVKDRILTVEKRIFLSLKDALNEADQVQLIKRSEDLILRAFEEFLEKFSKRVDYVKENSGESFSDRELYLKAYTAIAADVQDMVGGIQTHLKNLLGDAGLRTDELAMVDAFFRSEGLKTEVGRFKIKFNDGLQLLSNQTVQKPRSFDGEVYNIMFRYFIWRDMAEELIAKKAYFGINFGQPQRSKSIEILGMAWGEWTRDGWIAPHNSFLHVIYRAGLIGAGLLLTFVGAFVVLVRRFLKLGSVQGIMMCSIFIYWSVMANTLLIFEVPHNAIPLWSLFGMIWAYANDQFSRRDNHV